MQGARSEAEMFGKIKHTGQQHLRTDGNMTHTSVLFSGGIVLMWWQHAECVSPSLRNKVALKRLRSVFCNDPPMKCCGCLR
jgi:hypothetical protein